jgi:hypothetical protein
MYALSDRAKRGSRLPFRKYFDPELVVPSLELRRFLQTNNGTACEDQVSEPTCEAIVGCVWIEAFGNCIDLEEVVIIIIITIGPVDEFVPTAEDRIILVDVLIDFLSERLSTTVQAFIPIDGGITFNSSQRRMLQALGSFTVEYEATIRLTGVLTQGNVESSVQQVLTIDAATFIQDVVAAANVQGPTSSLNFISSLVVEDVGMKEEKACSGHSGFGFIFCVIAKAFGSFAGFIKWVINILTLGIFS